MSKRGTPRRRRACSGVTMKERSRGTPARLESWPTYKMESATLPELERRLAAIGQPNEKS